MKNKTEVVTNPIECFAVTDQFSIIPLKEVSRKTYANGLTKIETAISGDVKYLSHCKAHHNAYFKEMWLDDEKLDKQAVFLNINDAKSYALKQVNSKIAQKQRELESLKQNAAELSA